MMPPAESLVEELHSLDCSLYNRDCLLTWQHSVDELRSIMLTATILRRLYCQGHSTRLFDSGLAVSIFRDKSTRTRFSFASAASLVGLTLQELDEQKSQISHGETLRETANMISFVTQAIGIRDDLFLGFGHQYMRDVARAVEDGFRHGVLPQRPAVINLQCDQDHPTQTLSDLLHLQHAAGSLAALRGRRIAMTWAHSPSYGRPLSVPQGIIALMTRFGMEVVLAHPPGYELSPEIVAVARRHAAESGGALHCTDDLDQAFVDADFVYPKSWAPYEIMRQRTELLGRGAAADLATLEEECRRSNAEYSDWECTDRLMARTRSGQGLYMHCLPADISGVSCERGEVSAEVFERHRLTTYHQASYKPFVIAAMMLLCRIEHPVRRFGQLLAAG